MGKKEARIRHEKKEQITYITKKYGTKRWRKIQMMYEIVAELIFKKLAS